MDLYNLIISAKLSKGEGGDVSVDALSVTENGTYTAEEGHAYSPVTVDVPNSYTASDEGKVVDNGALVGQTSTTKTANGTYDTTLNDEVVVNVPSPSGSISITQNGTVDVTNYAEADVNVSGGGGGSSYTLLHKEDVQVSTTSTSQTVLKTISIPGVYTGDGIIYVRAYDKNGPRDGYYYETKAFIVNYYAMNPGSSDWSGYRVSRFPATYGIYYEGEWWYGTANSPSGYGIFPTAIKADDSLEISIRYDSGTTKTIDGTYTIEVYKIAYPE